MWPEQRTSYIERHLRFYYILPGFTLGYGDDSAEVVIDDCGKSFFLEKYSDPPFGRYKNMPVLFFSGHEQGLYSTANGKLIFKADLIAAIFFFLSGWQEVYGERQSQDSFKAAESWQSRNGMIQTPLVDFYFDLLAEAISDFKGVPFKRRFGAEPGMAFLSHDIDKLNSGRSEGLFNAVKAGRLITAIRESVQKRDPWDNLQVIAKLEEKAGVKSTFFMLPEKGRATGGTNADYEVQSNKVQQDLALLRRNGWEVGVHGSIGSHLDSQLFHGNVQKTGGEIHGNRFHYLNFSLLQTPGILEKSGISYDATLGFPDAVGFRFATSRPFMIYDLTREKATDILEIPLHVMDTTLQHPKYLGLKPGEAMIEMEAVAEQCHKFNGVFSLLWHNNYFSELKYPKWGKVYEDFISNPHRDFQFLTGREVYQKWGRI